jgi:hypothetical protein
LLFPIDPKPPCAVDPRRLLRHVKLTDRQVQRINRFTACFAIGSSARNRGHES